MDRWLIGIGIASGLFALLPSKKEAQWNVPWASAGLAINAGICFALGLPN